MRLNSVATGHVWFNSLSDEPHMTSCQSGIAAIHTSFWEGFCMAAYSDTEPCAECLPQCWLLVHTAHVWTPPYTDMNTMVTELHVQQTIQHNPEQKPTAWPYCRRMKPSHAQHAGAFRHNKHSRPFAEKRFLLGWFCFPCQAKPQAASKTQPSTKTPQLPTGSAPWENETTQRTSNYGFSNKQTATSPRACMLISASCFIVTRLGSFRVVTDDTDDLIFIIYWNFNY